MMLSMDVFIDASIDVMSTDRGATFTIWFAGGCLSSFGRKVLCGESRLSVSHDSPLSISFSRSISASLIVAYSAGAGLVPKGKHRNRNANFSTIALQVYAILAFAWILR